MYFGLAITNNSDFDQNGNLHVLLTFNPDAAEAQNVVKGYELDRPPVLDGADRGAEDWGDVPYSEVILTNLRGVDNGIGTEITPVRMRAGYDEKYIYFMVAWKEVPTGDLLATANWYPDRWRYNQTLRTWNREGFEDQFYLFWDISGVENWDTEGAALLYHDGDSSLYLDTPGMVDVWHWMAARTGLSGFVDDAYIKHESIGLMPDQGSSPYIPNVENGLPRWMHKEDPNFEATAGFGPPFDLWDTTPFDVDASWDPNATILGYISVLPLGSRADVDCCRDAWKVVLADFWVVEFRRLRNTGHGDDVQF
jgi:hypothetical protein